MKNQLRIRKLPIGLWFGLLVFSYCTSSNPSDVDQILSTIKIADGFQLELVAMEPLISDPVAMEIDENGDTYVVEMHGYPLNTAGSGTVKKLFDDDDDGVFDRSEVFYDQLVLPTGIMRWKAGVLVTDPPDLLYLEDTDGDGQADKKEVLLTGFALSNPQHNFNNPIYGLDNWVYLANEGTYESQFFGDLFNDEGSEIYFPGKAEATRLPKNASDLNLKVDLRNYQLQLLSGESQYGHTFGPWGHHFGTRNWSHIYHEVLDAPYIDRNKNLELPSTMQYVPDYGIGFEIFPITQNPEHQLLTDVGAITSSCGITWYLGSTFPEPFNNVMFVAEPTHNLVHTDIMYDQGPTFRSESQYSGNEFLASTDSWFRPVNFYIGPDGSMFMLDFHRKIIEHPEWMSEEVLNSGELYEGLDKGRIFKIKPSGVSKSSQENVIGQANNQELVQYLQHPNIWWRRHAQRLIVASEEVTYIPLLEEFLSKAEPLGVLHALWTLQGLNYLNKDLLFWAMDHSTPGVRENAIKIAERNRENITGLEAKLVSMKKDPDAKVRFQLLCTLGYYHSSQSAQARFELLLQDMNEPWSQLAALSAESLDAFLLFSEIVTSLRGKSSDNAKMLVKNLGRSIGKNGEYEKIEQVLDFISTSNNLDDSWWKSSILEGMSETVPRGVAADLNNDNRTLLTALFNQKENKQLRSSGLSLLYAMGYFEQSSQLAAAAAQVAMNPKLDAYYRRDAVKVLGWVNADDNMPIFKDIILQEKDPLLRESIIEVLRLTKGDEAGDFLLGQWGNFTPKERGLAVNVFNTNSQRQVQFLHAVESNQVQASVLGWGRTVRLLNSSDPQVRNLARKVLEGNESISDSIWQQYQEVLTLEGEFAKGKEVFQRSCAVCHQVSGQMGINYGPDLAAVGNRAKSGIMIDILKPNRSISDGYELWIIEDNQGQQHSGIIVNENSNTLTLRISSGEEVMIQQNTITNKTAAELSAMPEGLHNQITHQEMANLLEYLKHGMSRPN